MTGPRTPQTDLRMKWQHWLAPVLKGTEIQGFHIIFVSGCFQEKIFLNQWRFITQPLFRFEHIKNYAQDTAKNKIDAAKESQHVGFGIFFFLTKYF